MTREVVVVGAGIVGVALAAALSTHDDIAVTVLERDGDSPRGSTAFAPGFVGLYNEAPVLDTLARRSAEAYQRYPQGFVRAGGLELADSPAGVEQVQRRATAASAAGHRVQMLTAQELPTSVAGLARTDQILLAAHYLDDGVAIPTALAAALRAEAVGSGAQFLTGQEVTGIDQGSVVTASGDRFDADDIVLAGGVWGPTLTGLTGRELPLIPVAHPYVYSGANLDLSQGPFLRWPEHHVYAGVHGDRLGIGSYDHVPVPVEQATLAEGAGLAWATAFDPVVAQAQRLLAPAARFHEEQRVNGVFAMTPDNLPFLGPHPELPGVWIAQAIWVTHGAGAAAALAEAIVSGHPLPPELAVDRFDGEPSAHLRTAALRLYRDIYANESR